jgi:hypothetical protein
MKQARTQNDQKVVAVRGSSFAATPLIALQETSQTLYFVVHIQIMATIIS